MKPFMLLRVAAVCSSFLLVAGYILYRSGAAETILPSSKSARVLRDHANDEDAAQAREPQQQRAILPSSKVGLIQSRQTESFNLGPAPDSASTPSTLPAIDAPP